MNLYQFVVNTISEHYYSYEGYVSTTSTALGAQPQHFLYQAVNANLYSRSEVQLQWSVAVTNFEIRKYIYSAYNEVRRLEGFIFSLFQTFFTLSDVLAGLHNLSHNTKRTLEVEGEARKEGEVTEGEDKLVSA